MTEPDYPAAHSMDTDWFAVDAEGRLAFFESGEDAAVPVAVPGQGHGHDVLDGIALRVPHALVAELGRHVVEMGKKRWRATRRPHAVVHDITLLVREVQPEWVATPHSLGRGVAGPPIAAAVGTIYPVRFWRMEAAMYRALHEDGLCLGCAGSFWADGPSRQPAGLARLGVYVYEAQEYDNPPYDRLGVPRRPLLMTELPPDLRELAERVVLPGVRFADVEHVQPLEHVPCYVWGGPENRTYLASDLKTRLPVPPPPPQPPSTGG